MKIISNAKKQNRKKRDGNYYESHHILPKSLFPLWAKRKSNTVLLTAREHLFCHMLLVKIYPQSHEMWSALWYMSSKSKKEKSNYPKLTLREYEKIKIEYAKSNSNHLKGKKNPNMARILSEEALRKIGEKSKGNKNVRGKSWWTKGEESTMAFECPGDGWIKGRNTKGKKAWNKGISPSKETKEKQKQSLLRKIAEMSPEEKKKKYGYSKPAWNKGKKMSEEFRKKCREREAKKRKIESATSEGFSP